MSSYSRVQQQLDGKNDAAHHETVAEALSLVSSRFDAMVAHTARSITQETAPVNDMDSSVRARV